MGQEDILGDLQSSLTAWECQTALPIGTICQKYIAPFQCFHFRKTQAIARKYKNKINIKYRTIGLDCICGELDKDEAVQALLSPLQLSQMYI